MLIFEEHFQDNRHKWYVHDSAECTAQLGSNHYFFEHKRSGNISWLAGNSADFRYFYDKTAFRIYVVLEKVSGTLNHGYDIIWGLSDQRLTLSMSDTSYQFRTAKL
ncbi:MAG: hypothetical protein BRC40_11440 [Cyanobacteria bacterium QH_8_48_120]|nr:MAG: hypothetical protein BRC40_11440 [Cyanobacteria bacterium QH_8_48_120]